MKLLQAIASLTVLATVGVSQLVNIKINDTNQASLPSITLGIQPASAGYYMDDYFGDGTVLSIGNYGQSANLHYQLDGGMIHSLKSDSNDEDQKFVVHRKPGTNIIQLRRVNTKFLITPSTFVNLAPLEAYVQSIRSPFHPNQSWTVDEANDPGTFYFKSLAAPNLAMNLPNGSSVTKLTLFNFNPNDRDQRWGLKIHSYPRNVVQNVVPQTIQSTPSPTCKAIGTDPNYTHKFESVIAAVPPMKVNKPGHAFFGLILTRTFNFNDGNCGRKTKVTILYKTVSAQGPDTPAPTIIKATKSADGLNLPMKKLTNVNYDGWEMNELRSYYDKGMPMYNNEFAFLRKEIPAEMFNKIDKLDQSGIKSLIGCKSYSFLPSFKSKEKGLCHCGDVTARMWGNTTGDWRFNKDAKPSALFPIIQQQ